MRKTSCREDSGILFNEAVISCFKRDIFAERVLRFVERDVNPREWSREDIEGGSSNDWSVSRDRWSSREKLDNKDVRDCNSLTTVRQVDHAAS